MGPLIYCAEWVDNDNRTSNIILPATATFTTEFRQDLLNGINTIHSTVQKVEVDPSNSSISKIAHPFIAIPYYAWANRGKGEMQVWLNENIKDVQLVSGY